MKFYFRAVIGQLATAIWFLPGFCKWIHALRGVKFSDRRSVFITRDVSIDNKYPELISIGSDVWLTVGVKILSHAEASNFQKKTFGLREKVGAVVIEDGVFIGVNSVVLPGVTLGKGCYIGAGSIVTKSIPAGARAAGNPCVVIKQMSEVDLSATT